MTSYVYKSPTWKQVQEFLLDLHVAGRERKRKDTYQVGEQKNIRNKHSDIIRFTHSPTTDY